MTTPNIAAILVAALSAFMIGGLWYSPLLFGRAWMAENGFTEEDLKEGMPKIFGGSAILSLIIATNLGFFLGGDPGLAWGIGAGLLAGVGWVGCSFGITYLFERRSFKIFAINAGYHGVTFALMGAIFGLWP